MSELPPFRFDRGPDALVNDPDVPDARGYRTDLADLRRKKDYYLKDQRAQKRIDGEFAVSKVLALMHKAEKEDNIGNFLQMSLSLRIQEDRIPLMQNLRTEVLVDLSCANRRYPNEPIEVFADGYYEAMYRVAISQEPRLNQLQ